MVRCQRPCKKIEVSVLKRRGRFKKARGSDTQRIGKSAKRAQRRIPSAAFEIAQIAALHASPKSQFLLRQPFPISEPPHVLSEEGDDVHANRWPKLRLERRPPVVSFHACST